MNININIKSTKKSDFSDYFSLDQLCGNLVGTHKSWDKSSLIPRGINFSDWDTRNDSLKKIFLDFASQEK